MSNTNKAIGIVVGVAAMLGGRYLVRETLSAPTRDRMPSQITAPMVKEMAERASPTSDRVALAMERGMTPFLTDPLLRNRLARALAELQASGAANPQSAQRVGKELGGAIVARGLRRLPSASLDEWNRLRIVIASGSEPLCAAFWSGGANESDLAKALAAMNDADLASWFQISSDAGRLELANETVPVRVGEDDFGDGLEAMARTMPEETRSKLAGLIENPNLPAADACWVMRTVMEGARNLPGVKRERTLRALAAAGVT